MATRDRNAIDTEGYKGGIASCRCRIIGMAASKQRIIRTTVRARETIQSEISSNVAAKIVAVCSICREGVLRDVVAFADVTGTDETYTGHFVTNQRTGRHNVASDAAVRAKGSADADGKAKDDIVGDDERAGIVVGSVGPDLNAARPDCRHTRSQHDVVAYFHVREKFRTS